MASNAAAGTQQARSQPHMPRLSYRNSATGTILRGRRDSAMTVSTASSTAAAAPTPPMSPPLSECYPSPPLSRVTSGAQSTISADAVSFTNSTLSAEAPTKLLKKRGSSLFSFLSVKEPSQQAFLDYQESIRKQTAARSGRVTAVGMPGVSSAKLPLTVPRVNSKWDGVPQTLKEKGKEKKDARRPSLMSHRHSSSNATAGGLKSRRSSLTLGSQRSNPKSPSFFGNKAGNPSDSSVAKLGWESYSLSNGSSSKDLTSTSTSSGASPSTSPLPEMNCFFPQDVPKPPMIPAHYRSLASTEVPSHIDVPQHSVSPSLTPMETSPITPLKPENITEDGFQDTGKLFQRFERVTLNSDGANILAPPSTSKRRPSSHAISASNADQLRASPQDDQPPSILKQEPSIKRSEVLAKPPVSSYFPVIDAAPKGRSSAPRNRHDPASIVRSKDIAPWEWDQPSINRNEDTSPTPMEQSGKANMRKRLSVFGR